MFFLLGAVPRTVKQRLCGGNVCGLTHSGSSTDTCSRVGEENLAEYDLVLMFVLLKGNALINLFIVQVWKITLHNYLSWKKSFNFFLIFIQSTLHIPEKQALNSESWVTGRWRDARKHIIMRANSA